MSHPIPEDVQRLADRLRMAADEVESAARYGVPVPNYVSVGGHVYSGMSFAASEAEFAAWAEYVESEVTDYEHAGADWSMVQRADVNGLPVTFSVKRADVAVSA